MRLVQQIEVNRIDEIRGIRQAGIVQQIGHCRLGVANADMPARSTLRTPAVTRRQSDHGNSIAKTREERRDHNQAVVLAKAGSSASDNR
jgi:hypothetical protein